jgi:hypothetical protein
VVEAQVTTRAMVRASGQRFVQTHDDRPLRTTPLIRVHDDRWPDEAESRGLPARGGRRGGRDPRRSRGSLGRRRLARVARRACTQRQRQRSGEHAGDSELSGAPPAPAAIGAVSASTSKASVVHIVLTFPCERLLAGRRRAVKRTEHPSARCRPKVIFQQTGPSQTAPPPLSPARGFPARVLNLPM